MVNVRKMYSEHRPTSHAGVRVGAPVGSYLHDNDEIDISLVCFSVLKDLYLWLSSLGVK